MTPRAVTGKAVYATACAAAALVLVLSGYSYNVVNAVNGLGNGATLNSAPAIQGQNILLMGLESRTDWNGNILPNNILAALHAGSRQAVINGTGGNATNTLILIHIPNGGGRATGVSIPRDDWVNFADTIGPQQIGKIDQAYGVSLAFKEQQLRSGGQQLSQDQIAKAGNTAGQLAAIATVEKLTGVHIDHYAAINLDGFYELARVLHGVSVCLNHNVPLDVNSGFHSAAGYHHLDPRMALAFVRQRDGLNNGDLDRTHRQQAFLISILHQLRTQGVLSDAGQLSSLLSVARRYVITDTGWNLLQFAGQMGGLSSGKITFSTAPITGFEQIAGQDANAVDPAQIKQFVHSAFWPAPKPTRQQASAATATAAAVAKTTVDVFNGGSTQGLAGQVSSALVKGGYQAGQVTNTTPRATTVLKVGPGVPALAAANLGKLFGVTPVSRTSVAAGHVEVLLGSSATVPNIAPAPSATPSATPANNANGGTVSASASGSGGSRGKHGHHHHHTRVVNGVPCVD